MIDINLQSWTEELTNPFLMMYEDLTPFQRTKLAIILIFSLWEAGLRLKFKRY